MFMIEAAKRLHNALVVAMSEQRKTAMMKLRVHSTRDTLLEHYMLQRVFSHDVNVPHWQKECRTFLRKTLMLTELKGGKTLPLSDYLMCVWEGPAETRDLEALLPNLMVEKGMQAQRWALTDLDYAELSKEYKAWLTKWYQYYNDAHRKPRFELPVSVF